MINKLLDIPYVDQGRDYDGADCWGLVRLARVDLFGKAELPSFGYISAADKRRLTAAAGETIGRDIKLCNRRPGAIAAAWRGKLCTHVGVVVEQDGRQWVLETNDHTGAILTPPRVFEGRASRVEYYD